MKKSLLFVCHGNIHRSVIAEACVHKRLVAEGLDNEICAVSRGLQGTQGSPLPRYPNLRDYEDSWRLAEPSLIELGIEIPPDKNATPISAKDVEDACAIFALDTLVLRNLPNALSIQFPEARSKMRLLRDISGITGDIEDCAKSKTEVMFSRVTHQIFQTINNNWKVLLAYTDRQ